MRLFFSLTAVLAIGLSTSALSAQSQATQPRTEGSTEEPVPAWRQALIKQQQALVAENGPGTNQELKQQLMTMWACYQSAHTAKPGENVTHDRAEAAHIANESLHQEFAGIIEKNGWPTISLVGIEASDDALNLLVQFRDTALRERLLPQLEALAADHKIAGSGVASLIDQDLVEHAKKQRYGTLYRVSVEDRTLTFFNIEDLPGLDARRAQMGLPPMDFSKQTIANMMNMSVSNHYISPGALRAASTLPE